MSEAHSDMDATYSPEDNKLRLYSLYRLDPEVYERVKAHGFRWAPKQDLFVAPAWTPAREEFLVELCGEIGDEDTSLADRADERADRFDTYQGKRLAEAEQARAHVASITDGIPLGQPILVGHHSQRRAEKDAQKIQRGMEKAVSLWRTSKYWTSRAAGVRAHSDYKHRPDATARRIKKLEADRRRQQRHLDEANTNARLWSTEGLTLVQATLLANHHYGSYCFTLAEYPRDEPASQYEGRMGLWSALDSQVITAEQAAALAIASARNGVPWFTRWIEHYTLRIGYERAILGLDTPAEDDTPKAKRSARPKLPPIVNFDGRVLPKADRWDNREPTPLTTKTITKDEWKRKNRDYKAVRTSACGAYRYRTMMYREDGHLTTGPVFIEDQKMVFLPEGVAAS